MAIRTSQDISDPLAAVFDRQHIQQNLIAHDLGMSKQNVSGAVNGDRTTPENAVKISRYMHDPKFNQQMAAIYFDAISVFDPDKWAKKFRDAPFATWVQLRHVEQHRMEIGEKVFDFGVKDRSEWTKEETELAYEWMNGLLKTISLATLMASQFADMAHYDLDSLVEKFNRLWGGVERK